MRAIARVRLVGAIVGALACSAPAGAQGGSPPITRSITVLTPVQDDDRVVAMREAIAFWNRTLAELGVRARLLDPVLIVASPASRSIEGYARTISQHGGRVPRDSTGPEAPEELTGLTGDIVVLLSTQPIFSFAWPLAHTGRYFLAIQTDRMPPLNAPGVSRDVIAHELGHTLGLIHNADPTTLMCGPCAWRAFGPGDPPFLPLTAEDRMRLREMNSPQ